MNTSDARVVNYIVASFLMSKGTNTFLPPRDSIDMLVITPHVVVPFEELELKAVRSSGPGGQHVNKVSTAVQLQFDIHSSSLPDEIKERLREMSDHRISDSGRITILAKSFRSQEKNRKDAIQRFQELIRKAAVPRRKRKKTSIPKSSKIRRLRNKKFRSEVKSMRKKVDPSNS